jgi:two-component system cell cycle response regulator
MTTILLVEDSEIQRQEIRRILAKAEVAERILEAGDGCEGISLLASESVDVVVCDLDMPRLDGRKLLQYVESTTSVPVIFLTATQDPALWAELLDQGACDAISKPFHAYDLAARVRLHLRIKRLRDELEEKNRRLALLSTTDEVTGLRNRRCFEERLSVECERGRRHGSKLALLLLDIDDFKQVNDRSGHPAGDEALRHLGGLLRARTRRSDLAIRYGGDEFALLLVESGIEGALIYAEQLRQAVAEAVVPLDSGGTLRLTISVGVASWRQSRPTPEALVAAADAALYRAKAAGRNRVEAAPLGPLLGGGSAAR